MKTNGELVLGKDCAMFDNVQNSCREIWRSGTLAVIVSQELCVEEPEVVRKMIDSGRIPHACSLAWVNDQIQGNIEHIPMPYRPAAN